LDRLKRQVLADGKDVATCIACLGWCAAAADGATDLGTMALGADANADGATTTAFGATAVATGLSPIVAAIGGLQVNWQCEISSLCDDAHAELGNSLGMLALGTTLGQMGGFYNLVAK